MTRRDHTAETMADLVFDTPLPAKPKRGLSPEWRLHASAAKLCYRLERSNPDFRFFSPGGEGARSPARAEIAKRMGQNRKGVPDMWMFLAQSQSDVLMCVVEFKRPGGKLTPEQRDWFMWLPCDCHVVTDLEQFRSILADFIR